MSEPYLSAAAAPLLVPLRSEKRPSRCLASVRLLYDIACELRCNMTSFALNNIASPEVRREIEMRLELWQQIIGSGPPESFCARARSAGYKMPRARGFRIDLSESLEFSAQTGADAAPYFEFSVGVSLALRACRS